MSALTPAQFGDSMLAVVEPKEEELKKLYAEDPDLMQVMAINLMEAVLQDLGYTYGIRLFRKARFKELAKRAKR